MNWDSEEDSDADSEDEADEKPITFANIAEMELRTSEAFNVLGFVKGVISNDRYAYYYISGDPNHKAGINADTPMPKSRTKSDRTERRFRSLILAGKFKIWQVIQLRQPRAGLTYSETTPLLRCPFRLQQLVPIFVERVKGKENVDVGDVRQELLQYINPVFQHKLKPAESWVPQSSSTGFLRRPDFGCRVVLTRMLGSFLRWSKCSENTITPLNS